MVLYPINPDIASSSLLAIFLVYDTSRDKQHPQKLSHLRKL